MKDYDKKKNPLCLKYCDRNIFHESAMSQTLPIGSFKWVENTSQFSNVFTENCNEDNHKEYFLQVDVQYSGILDDLNNDLPLFRKK